MTPTPVTLRYDTRVAICAGPGCTNTIAPQPTGRPAHYCSTACRVRHHRQRQRLAAVPVAIEVDMGSATSRGRPPEHAWLVRIRRADRTVIVAAGLRRSAADRLAEQLTDLLADTPQPAAPKTVTGIGHDETNPTTKTITPAISTGGAV